MTTPAPAHTTTRGAARAPIGRAPVASPIRHGYWRITAPDGRVLGNLEQSESTDATDGTSFLARRFHTASAAYIPLGRFRSMADALDTFRA